MGYSRDCVHEIQRGSNFSVLGQNPSLSIQMKAAEEYFAMYRFRMW